MDQLPRRPEDRTLAPRLGKALYVIQRWVTRRAWALIVLILVTEGAGILAGELKGPEYRATARLIAHLTLLVLGLVAFWIWPRKAKFMKRLVVLLLFFGALLVLPGFLHAASQREWNLGAAWHALGEYKLTDLGLTWLYSGLGLLAVMGLGLVVRQRILARRRAAGAIKPVQAARPSSDAPNSAPSAPAAAKATTPPVAAPAPPSAPTPPPAPPAA